MIFETYSLGDRSKVFFEVEKKIITNVRGHFTYTLIGTSNTGKLVSAIVNKSQWDNFDVPIEEREINKRTNKKKERAKHLNPKRKRKTPVPKDKRKVYNEEIEKWLIEHYNLHPE